MPTETDPTPSEHTPPYADLYSTLLRHVGGAADNFKPLFSETFIAATSGKRLDDGFRYDAENEIESLQTLSHNFNDILFKIHLEGIPDNSADTNPAECLVSTPDQAKQRTDAGFDEMLRMCTAEPVRYAPLLAESVVTACLKAEGHYKPRPDVVLQSLMLLDKWAETADMQSTKNRGPIDNLTGALAEIIKADDAELRATQANLLADVRANIKVVGFVDAMTQQAESLGIGSGAIIVPGLVDSSLATADRLLKAAARLVTLTGGRYAHEVAEATLGAIDAAANRSAQATLLTIAVGLAPHLPEDSPVQAVIKRVLDGAQNG